FFVKSDRLLEETAWHIEPQALLGVYRWRHPTQPVTYLRFACGFRRSRSTIPADAGPPFRCMPGRSV
ncbi:MAG: hypothetical protein AAB174_02730, partial [Pseudomonadota bacterium]